MKPILYALLLIFPIFTNAQMVEGTITDDKNQAIEDVFIYSLKQNLHTHTNVKGQFELKGIQVGDTLIIESFGYNTKYLPVDEVGKEIKISMSPLSVTLEQVSITPGANINDMVAKVDLSMNPVSSSQALLPVMPGLFIGQHAGGGKAEQIFLRGFDIDHGTDLRITVDGMPVNMNSHAHGQGYADLHFLIPETVENISFAKGPYDASQGNFATAGQISFQTKDHVDQTQIIQEVGQFNTWRSVVLLNLSNKENNTAFVAGEYRYSDGPFVSSQDFSRLNGMAKWTLRTGDHSKISMMASAFTSTWLASGQVPQRAIDAGLISRFGAIDDTEGGTTSRYNFNIQHQFTTDHNDIIKTDIWYSKYQFDLFSNFTFFLDDPINGDQIRQKENRDLFGINTKWMKNWKINNWSGLTQAGITTRTDLSKGNGLMRTANRTTVLETHQLGDVTESSASLYGKQLMEYKRWSVEAGLRFDYFNAFYQNYTGLTSNHSNDDMLLSPSLSVSYNPGKDLQLYGKIGRGFHSNDARLSIFDARTYLTPALGSDLGVVYKLSPDLLIDAAVWHLSLEEELVYVGDAGVIEPSGKSRRYGLDGGIRYAPFQWAQLRLDANYTVARSVEDPEGENFIPLAPRLTSAATLSVKHPGGLKANLSYRYMGDRAANEDYSIVAKGYFVTDLNASYTWKKLELGFVVENLLNTQWNETQFATESRLFDEAEPVEEIHFIPGTPFNIRAKIGYRF